MFKIGEWITVLCPWREGHSLFLIIEKQEGLEFMINGERYILPLDLCYAEEVIMPAHVGV